MFKEARIKLTAWYLLIIMFISMVFSCVIYRVITFELERGLRRQEMRFMRQNSGLPLVLPLPQNPQAMSLELIDELILAKKRVAQNLILLNGIILGVSATAGYFLAGKTLKPIEEALEEQKRFIADASHELRTPLTALKTSMEVALRDKKLSTGEAKKVIKSNLEDINGLQSLSSNLLNLANLQGNGKNLVFESVDLSELIKNACRKILPLVKEKNIKIRTKAKKQEIKANKESLEGMLLIFLDNAVKYTPKAGRIVITTESDKKNIVIKIKDTGIGIPSQDIPHIFDRFYRVDQSRCKTEVPGFGLGLSLAKKIIELHKGSVQVTSVLNKGTTFTIKLPLKHS
ncbi:MAG TPA: HAMP domain-containing sensor histidine kinase [Candidatus Bathyarchaeia archaeon]|nr:HAMP domain-containing sensor histidine kinase [Candidatus Bathyarchaeia archaeon]